MRAAPPAAPVTGSVTPVTPRLEECFAHLLAYNPFTDNRINAPSPEDVDVDAIHQAAFARLQQLAHEALAARRGIGTMLWGEAGIGKSHLLSRLGRWAGGGKNACFVYLHNLQASPANLPRSLLRAVVSILSRGQVRALHTTPLFQLVLAAVSHTLAHRGGVVLWPQVAEAYADLVDRISARHAGLVDRTAYDVLFRFFRSVVRTRQGKEDGTEARLALHWLGGDALDADDARQLGLPPGRTGEPLGLADNQEIKQVLVALTELAFIAQHPFVLCLDQVDNLDADQMAALARFLEALIDSSPNLLVVTTGIQASLLRWRQEKVIQDSAWDRLAQFEVALQRIGVEAARHIVAARVQQALAPFRDVPAVADRLREEELFPLGQAWASGYFHDKVELRPRDVINAAREGWRREQERLQHQGGAAWLAGWSSRQERPDGSLPPPVPGGRVEDVIDYRVAQKVAELKEQRLREPSTLPPDGDHLAGLLHHLLEQCRRADPSYGIVAIERSEGQGGQRPPYHAVVRLRQGAGERRVGLRCLVTAGATSTAADLRRLLRDPEPPDRLLLLTDTRQPAPLAARGREYLDELRGQGPGFLDEVELSFADIAELDALHAVVWLARAGDLEVEMPPGQVRTVSEQDVIASHYRQARFRTAPVLSRLWSSP